MTGKNRTAFSRMRLRMMNRAWRCTEIIKVSLSTGYAGFRAVTCSIFRPTFRLWTVIAIAAISGLVGFFVVVPGLTVNAEDDTEFPLLYCLSCHVQELEIHDKLGSQNEACWSCHDKSDMSMLHLANGEPMPLSESSSLCGQCHQERYDSWLQGTHGVPGTIATASCTTCHDPHMPAVVLTNITKPHTLPAPEPPSPPSSDVLIIGGVSLVVLIILGVVVGRRGRYA